MNDFIKTYAENEQGNWPRYVEFGHLGMQQSSTKHAGIAIYSISVVKRLIRLFGFEYCIRDLSRIGERNKTT